MRILIIDDHEPVRLFIRFLLRDNLGHLVVGDSGLGREGIELARTTSPDLLILDLVLPDVNGLIVAAECKRLFGSKTPKILFISGFCSDYSTYHIGRLNVSGFILKSNGFMDDLLCALKAISSEQTYFCKCFIQTRKETQRASCSFDKILTNQEQRVLELVGSLLTDDQISEQLSLAPSTVEKHRLNIINKLDLQSRVELIRYARDHGFTTILPDINSPFGSAAI